MSEHQPPNSALDSVSVPFPHGPDPFFDTLLPSSKLASSTEDASSQPPREGLPPSYRMRNAHYVDELEERARRLSDDGPRVPVPAVSDTETLPSAAVVGLALHELTRGLEGLSSCFNLLSTEARPLRERLGLQLAQVEARRARAISRTLRVILAEPRLTRRAVNVAELLRQVLDEMRDEFQLARIDVRVDPLDPVRVVWGDSSLLAVALTGIAGMLVSALESIDASPTLRARVVDADRLVTVRLLAEGVTLPAEVARLFDLEWSARPGGAVAGTALVAARHIAQLHEGRLEATQDQAGLMISLGLPVRE